MKGIVFNLLEEAVVEEHGDDAWEDVLDDAGLDGAYSALGNYDDAELAGLVAALSARRGTPSDEVVRSFGRVALPSLAARYPAFFTRHESVKPFLLTLDRVIHQEVVKIYPGATPPRIWFDDPAPDELVVHYASARRMCAFAEGMIEGAAAHYGQSATLRRPACVKRGAAHCTIHAVFS